MTSRKSSQNRLRSIIFAFIKLGFIAFGGPAAAYAMMRQEFVSRRRWLTEEDFFGYLGIANLVPGPNATEMAMLIGHHHAGWWGLFLGGIAYILPAMFLVTVIAMFYLRFGSLPALERVLYGIKPVVIAILISAIWGMLKPRLKQPLGLGIAIVAGTAYFFGVRPLILLVLGGILMGTIHTLKDFSWPVSGWFFYLPQTFLNFSASDAAPFSLLQLFLVFLKAGALMVGSGYVLIAFIRDDLVVHLNWLTESQLVDAIAVGQVTPGPLSTTATFVGTLLGGLPGAVLATFAMFLPSFMVVMVVVLFFKRYQLSDRLGKILEGVSFAALGLMAGVTIEIANSAVTDLLSAAIAIVATCLLFLFDLNVLWLILGGGLIGLFRAILLK